MKREGVTIDTANLEIAEELPPLRVQRRSEQHCYYS